MGLKIKLNQLGLVALILFGKPWSLAPGCSVMAGSAKT